MSKKPFFKKRFSTDGWPSVDFLLNQLEGRALTCLRPALRVRALAEASPLLGYSLAFDQDYSGAVIRTSTRVPGCTLKAWIANLKVERKSIASPAVYGWAQVKSRELESAHRCWQSILIRAHACSLVHADMRASNLMLATGEISAVLDWEPQVLVRDPHGYYRVLGNHPVYRQIRIQTPSEFAGGAIAELSLVEQLKTADLQVLNHLIHQARSRLDTIALTA